jgi:hypothetical protein
MRGEKKEKLVISAIGQSLHEYLNSWNTGRLSPNQVNISPVALATSLTVLQGYQPQHMSDRK